MEGGWRPFLWSHPTSDGRLLQNVNDLNQWLSALRKASAPNPDKLAACHSGAFRSSRWTCCLQAERSGEGAGRAEAPPSLPVNQRVFHLRLGWLCKLGQVAQLLLPQSSQMRNGADNRACLVGL